MHISLNKNKYRVESIRLKEWEYSNPWWYYVTINTKNHVEWFGKIEKERMKTNKIGELVEKEWKLNKVVRKNIDLDFYVIMPNHIHGIIIIDEKVETTGPVVSNKNSNETMQRIVSTTLRPNSLGSIIGQFKSVCTKQIHAMGYKNFAWQPRYYDRIIRNNKELFNIRKYIDENPLKWYYEKDNSENIYDL